MSFISVYTTRKSHYTRERNSWLATTNRLCHAPARMDRVLRPHIHPFMNCAPSKNFWGYRCSSAFNSHGTVQFHSHISVSALRKKWRLRKGLSKRLMGVHAYFYLLVMRDEYILAFGLTENLNHKNHFEIDILYTDKNTTVYAWILNRGPSFGALHQSR